MKKDKNGFFPIKVLFLGTSNVGKTSIIKRLINEEDYKIDLLHDLTIDLNIYLKAFIVEGQLIKYELYDTPGIIGAMTDNLDYIKLANVVIFVFDLSSRDSFFDMKVYFDKYKEKKKKLNLKNDAIVIGNKLDKRDRDVHFEEINDFCIENNVDFFEMSAKDDKIGFNKLSHYFENLAKNILFKHKIIIKDNFFDIVRFRYISKRDENTIKPSLIYKQIDIFVKSLSNLFSIEDYILQIINGINDFYKLHIFKKSPIKTFHDLKKIIYNLEVLKSKLIDINKLVSLKYSIIKNSEKLENKKRAKNDQKNTAALNNEKIIIEFINSNNILKKAIHYCIHDYIINFIFEFNNEILLYKRLNILIKEDKEESNFVFRYFTNTEITQEKILGLFNDKYEKYLSANELHQYYLFIRNIKYLFAHLNNAINENGILTYFEKAESTFNVLKDYIYAFNKQWEKVKNENLKKLNSYDIEKNIKHYCKKCLKYFKYVLFQYDSSFKYDKSINNIFNCVKIRLSLTSFYFALNKKYDYVFYFYSAFLLITEYLNIKKETQNDNIIEEEKEIFELFNKKKEMIFNNSLCVENLEDEKSNKEMKKKLKYIFNNSIEFLLQYNQEKEDLKYDSTSKIGVIFKNYSNEKYLDFFSFPSIILKIYKSLDPKIISNEKMKTKIKLYEIYQDSLTYFKRGTFIPFFKCLSQNFSKKESLISYDGNNFSSMKIEISNIENILTKNDFLPSDIAQLFNIMGIGLMLLFRKNDPNMNEINDDKIRMYKKYRELALMLFNAGLNETLIQKAKELDKYIQEQLYLNYQENNSHLLSLEKIRNCIKYNITILLLIKDKTRINNLMESFECAIYDQDDFPLNYYLEKEKYLYQIFYYDKIQYENNYNNYFTENILNIFPDISRYYPYFKNNEKLFLNYYINISNNDEYDLINALILLKKEKIELITPQNFKAKFTNNYNNSSGEERELFNNILSKENLNNINYWKKKFDNKQGKGFLFNPIYFNYLSKYYNLKINIFSKENKENPDELKLIQTIGNNNVINIYLICDNNLSQSEQAFIPLINKNEIYGGNINNNLMNYLLNLVKRADEYYNTLPQFSNYLLWIIMNTIKIVFISEKVVNEVNQEIIDILLNTMYKLGLYEQIIFLINENIDTFLKSDKKYFVILYNSYKKLCLYDNCIEVIKKYLFLNNAEKKVLNYDTVKKINNLKQKDFNFVYSLYKKLEKERPIIFTPPLMDEDYVKILEEKTKNSDDNIFNLEAQISKEKIEINEKAKIQQILEKKKDGNKFRILCIEGGNIRSLIQILYLCEIENYIKKPISQAFDCIVTSKDGIFICGLLSAENEKKEIKYHANDILKIFNKQKETIYNSKLKKELKLNLLKKLIDIPEIFGNLFFFDVKSEAMIKIGSNDYIFDLFENYIDIPDEKDLKISLNQILRIIPKNINQENIWLMSIGNGQYKFNEKKNDEEFLLKKILKEQFLCLDVPLNTCKDDGNYSLQNLDNKFNELLTNCIEYFSEIKENNTLYEQLDKFFNVTNNNNICI